MCYFPTRLEFVTALLLLEYGIIIIIIIMNSVLLHNSFAEDIPVI